MVKHFRKGEIVRRAAYTAEQIELLRIAYNIAAGDAAYGRGNAIIFNGVRFFARCATYYGEQDYGEVFDIVMPRDLKGTSVISYLHKVERDVIDRLEIID